MNAKTQTRIFKRSVLVLMGVALLLLAALPVMASGKKESSSSATAQPQSSSAGTTITVWWNKGYYAAEDAAITQAVNEWQAKTGNKMNLTFYSTEQDIKKVVAAIASGSVPDIAYADQADFELTPTLAWQNKLTDVSSVVAPVANLYTKTALLSAHLYNNTKKARAYYAVPIKQQALHMFYWKDLLNEAGYTASDIPDTWNAYWDFWYNVQKKLRAQGKRVYGVGFPVSSTGTDNSYTFNQFLLAYGQTLVTPSGQLEVDNPAVREAAIKALTLLTSAYINGYTPPSSINWGDADNNVAFYSKQIVMTPNASLSIPGGKQNDPAVWKLIITQGMPLGTNGKPVPSIVAVKSAFIPVGAAHPKVAMDFLSFLIEPKRLDQYLVASHGRWFPVMPTIVKDDPFWTSKENPAVYTAGQQETQLPTLPWPQEFNPAYAKVNAEQIWGKAEDDVIVNKISPAQAVDQAFAQIKQIFSDYQISN